MDLTVNNSEFMDILALPWSGQPIALTGNLFMSGVLCLNYFTCVVSHCLHTFIFIIHYL